MPRTPMIVGGVVLVVCVVGWVVAPAQFYRAYLWAWLLCLAAALGSMSVVMLHHLTGGEWGYLVRRPAEAAGMTMPLLLVLFVPIAIGAARLFPWANAADVSASAILQHRRVAFGTGFVLARSFVYLLIWCVMGWRLHSLSLAHDRDGDARTLARLRRCSAVGLVVYFATMSLAAMDWIASREVDWYSSTFGLLTVIGQSVTGVAFLIVVLRWLADRPPVSEVFSRDRVHDLGNLLLTCVVLWSYVSFAQLLVIWMGNTQEDNIWYIHRTHRGWWWASLALVLLHFAVPFVVLLFQEAKRDVRKLALIAAGVLVMRGLDNLWMIAPSSMGPEPRGLNWLDLFTPLALGGVWVSCFVWLLLRHPLIPLGYRVPIEPLSYDADVAKEQSLA